MAGCRFINVALLLLGLAACTVGPATVAGDDPAGPGRDGLGASAPASTPEPVAVDTPLPSTATVSSPRRFHLEHRYRLRNDGPGRIDRVTVAVALPPDRANQRIANLQVSPPGALRVDRYGQRLALYELGELPPGQELNVTWQAEIELSALTFTLDPDRTGGLGEVPAAVARLYGGDAPDLRLGSPAIRAAAREAAGGATTPYWLARNVHDYVAGRLDYVLDDELTDAESTLKRGNGSCGEYSQLFIALCRANGLPARYVAATFYRSGTVGEYRDSSYHGWAEVFLPRYGWVPVDVTYDDVLVPGSHEFFGATNNRHFVVGIGGWDSEYLGHCSFRSRVAYSGEKPRLTSERYYTWTPQP